MKKLLLSLGLFGALSANAQLSANSFGADFTITAYQPWLSTAGANNNGTYNLYDYLDRGYTVILDLSATWCGPCYNYHSQHVLDQLWENYGVAGQPGVSVNTQDKVLVIWADVDGSTSDATVLDGSGSIGNWLNTSATAGVMPAAGTTGNVMFPMANPASASANSIARDYQLAYYPTIYRICPNRNVTEVGQLTYTALVNSLGVCETSATQTGVDLKPVRYTAESEFCSANGYVPKAVIVNHGETAATNVVVDFKQNGTVVSTVTVPSIAAYGQVEVTGSPAVGLVAGALRTEVSNAADAVTTNNSISTTLRQGVEATTSSIYFNLSLDNYGSETAWYLYNEDTDAMVHIANYGTYANRPAAQGTSFPQEPFRLELQPNTCYEFLIADNSGDGICCQYGQGTFSVTDANGRVLVPYQSFNSSFSRKIFTGATLNTESIVMEESVKVFPNPATDRINISFFGNGADFTVSLIDLQGREVHSNVVNSIAGDQLITIPTEGLSTGSYIVKLQGGNSIVTKSVVIK